jgi:thiol-disulfide isomerase/thioredoxin
LLACAAVVLLASCSRTDAPVTASRGAASQVVDAASAVITPAVAAAVSAGVADHGIAWRRPAGEADMEKILAESRASGRPVFLYWGAQWCPPCNQVKATVFNRAEFIEQSRAFLPVYLDGDLPGAQKLGARFKVRGYPTMILLRPDGGELTRLPGEVDAQKYLNVLSLGMGLTRPVAEVLAQARSAPAGLSAADWRLLAYYAWDTDEQQLVEPRQMPRLLQQLAGACPEQHPEARTRLALKALVAQAGADGVRKVPPPGARAQLLAVLGDGALLQENLDLVVNQASELTAFLTKAGTTEREQLAAIWAAALDRLTADDRLSQGDRASALVSRVALARLQAGIAEKAPVPADKPLSPVLQEHVQREAARFDAQISSDVERQSVIPSAAYALQQAGLLADSDRLLEAELKRSHSPYYAMLSLASNAKLRGDKTAALGWYERAYRESKGVATRVQWGATYVNALVELAPDDTARIERGARSVFGEVAGQPDAFYERTARALERMSGKLLAWNRGPAQARVLGSLREQRDGLCAALPAADPQRPTCDALLAVPTAAKPGTTSPTART